MPVVICMTIHMERTCNCHTRKVTKEVGPPQFGMSSLAWQHSNYLILSPVHEKVSNYSFGKVCTLYIYLLQTSLYELTSQTDPYMALKTQE